MNTKSIRRILLPVLGALIVLLAFFALPFPVDAEEGTIYASNEPNTVKYNSIEEAWKAAIDGTIVMQSDWCLPDDYVLELPEGKSATIRMNGKKIYRDGSSTGRIFYLNDNSELDLRGTLQNGDKGNVTFNFDYYDSGRNKKSATVENVGGLVTGGYSNYGSGGAIYMEAGARLVLNHVAVAGNYSSNCGGGVYLDNSSEEQSYLYDIRMINGAVISYNYSGVSGGGIYLNGGLTVDHQPGIYIYMTESHIDNNFAKENGGGICSFHADTNIEMASSSTINNNKSDHDGGGIFYQGYLSTIKGGTVSGNSAASDGGGVFARTFWGNTLTIEGTAFSSNTAGDDGGAIYTSVKKTEFKNCDFSLNKASDQGGGIYVNGECDEIYNCTFTSNSAGDDGGGVYMNDNDLTIEDSTLTGNSAGDDGGGVFVNDSGCVIVNSSITENRVTTGSGEGGGVFVDSRYDIKLRGRVVIKKNYRANNTGNVDDLFLQDGSSTTAYIIEAPSNYSEVGIRTDANKERRKIGEGQNFTYEERYFFSDVKGFYLDSRTTDELWLSYKESASYAVYVNGVLQGWYNASAMVNIDGTPTDSNKVFKRWTEEKSHENLLANQYAVSTTVYGPTNNHPFELRFNAVYVTKISDVTLTVDKPVAGQNLPTEGILSWKDENGNSKETNVGVYWLVQNSDGTTQTASGKADYATKYSVAAKIGKNLDVDLVFADAVTGTVKYKDTEGKNQTNKVYVDQQVLYMYGNQIETEKAVITGVEDANISIKMGSAIDDLKKLLPTTATVYDAQGNNYTVEVSAGNADLSAILDAENTYVKNETGNYSVTIPLNLKDTDKVRQPDNESKKLKVNVTVYSEGILSAPEASGGDQQWNESNQKFEKKITLSAAEGTIKYESYVSGSSEGELASFSDYSANGITIYAEKGEKKTWIIKAYATKPGSTDSTVATFTYTLDNPFTVTINEKINLTKAADNFGSYTAKYYKDDKVTIGAPVVSGYVFNSWSCSDGSGVIISDEDKSKDSFTVDSIRNDITVTALYDPILTVESLNIKLTAPKASEALEGEVTEVKAVVSGKDASGGNGSQTIDMTTFLGDNKNVTWYDGDTEVAAGSAAEYKTVYTAKLTLPNDTTTVKFASLKDIVVYDAKNNIIPTTAEVKEENGGYAVYITFPATEAASDYEPEPAPTPKKEDEGE